LRFLQEFRLRPREQIEATFTPDHDTGKDEDEGVFKVEVKGLWVDTILYEIPLLALTSEAYFRFMDKDWKYDGQEEKAHEKGMRLLEGGCIVSEFGTRRRRDYHTQALVIRGLVKASKEGAQKGLPGKISGTSNVHLAMRFGIPPVGTVGHEWFMGVAAITSDYERATETALSYWVGCFGQGVLGIALTDTFGTASDPSANLYHILLAQQVAQHSQAPQQLILPFPQPMGLAQQSILLRHQYATAKVLKAKPSLKYLLGFVRILVTQQPL
jgi:nicotinate phosphoribosyltransferase